MIRRFKKFWNYPLFLIFILIGSLPIFFFLVQSKPLLPIKIALIYSEGNNTSPEQNSFVQVAKLAIAEINEKGGILDRPIILYLINSEKPSFEREIEDMMGKNEISSFFGCESMNCLARIKPILEKNNNLLFYPSTNENYESSTSIISFGSTPNQQIIPGVRWAFDNIGVSYVLIGSYQKKSILFHQIAKDIEQVVGGVLLGEIIFSENEKLTKSHFLSLKKILKKNRPKFIFTTLEGEKRQNLFDELKELSFHDLPILLPELEQEKEINFLIKNQFKNIYSLENYFQELPTEVNRRFVKNMSKLGNHGKTPLNSKMENLFNSIYLWAETVKQKRTANPLQVNTVTLLRQTVAGPSGVVAIDGVTRNAWRFSEILHLKEDGKLETVDRSLYPLRPSLLPIYRTREEWENILKNRLIKKEISQ